MQLRFFTLLLLVGLATSAPSSSSSSESDEHEKVVITSEFYPESLVKYTAKYDIVNMYVPLNSLNFDDDSEDDDSVDFSGDNYIFFVEADKGEDGKQIEKGLYVLKDGNVTKLLEYGRDIAAGTDDSKDVYFAAKDGIYKYDISKNAASKYGSIDDNIIGIAKINGTDAIYILTNEHELYKVTEEGTKKEKIEAVVNAQQIVIDYENNLFFYGKDKHPYVFNDQGVKKIEGLPSHPSEVTLTRPPFILDNGVPFISDKLVYVIYANGTVELTDFEFKSRHAKPSAYSMEVALVQYYAYDKKIYEYNILILLLGEILDELKKFLSDKTETIQGIATNSRSKLRA